jgi:hypothetical protein
MNVSINHTLMRNNQVLNILQDHYPERLGLALILNVPFLLRAFWNLITPFVDPVTRPKMKFNPSVVEDNLIAPEMLMKEWWGGDRDFAYEHDQFWPAIVSMCEKQRKQWFDAWKKLGGTVGLKEWDYKTMATSNGTPEKSKDQVVKQEAPVEATCTNEV